MESSVMLGARVIRDARQRREELVWSPRCKTHSNANCLFPREMAVGNTFGATALSSYGGFWIAYGILLTPNWGLHDVYVKAGGTSDPNQWNSVLGFFLTGWFIFTTILLLCTLRSTVMFFMLFFTLDLAFLMLACSDYAANNGAASSSKTLQKAGGGFGMLAAFLAWYNAFAGIADTRSVVNNVCHVLGRIPSAD